MNIAIFASGNGSNAQQIAEYFKASNKISVALIASNKSNAYVLERAKNLGIRHFSFTPSELKNTFFLPELLKQYNIDYIVLAGFLLMIPKTLVDLYPNKIINIHPALLPKFGGKGMYGNYVHEAVIASREKSSGITIHLVNEYYDEGDILFQAECEVCDNDTPESLAERIHQLEHFHYPRVIESWILKQ